MGLRGSGQIYTLPSESCWAQLGIQRSTWSDQDAVDFTVNLSVISTAAWARAVEENPSLGAKPSPNTYSLSRERFQQRIGRAAGGGDYWWRLTADGRDEAATCDDFLTMVEAHGLPVLRREVEARR